MYMFFWFFKQLYYCLRRIFKSGLLLLIVFFIAFLFIFIKPTFASTTLDGYEYNGEYHSFNTPLQLTNNKNSYVVLGYNNFTTIRVVEPYDVDGYLVAYNYRSSYDLNSYSEYGRLQGFYNNSLADIKAYFYDVSSGTWTSLVSDSSGLLFNDTSRNPVVISVSNTNSYLTNFGMITERNLPAGITFTDNIVILSQNNGNKYLLKTSSSDNYFYFNSGSYEFTCKTSSGSSTNFSIYSWNSTYNKFTLLQDNINSFNTGQASATYYNYSTNKLHYNTAFYELGFHDFFDYLNDLPYIVNSINDIETWNFDYLTINCGTVNPYSSFYLDCDYEGYTFSYDYLVKYTTITNNIATIRIPKSLLNESIVLRNGFNFSFNLQARTPQGQVLFYELGSYTLNLTTEQEEQINEDSNKQVLSDISNNQKETTQAIENLENTITNSNIDDSSIDLPIDNSTDITQDGLNGIFTSIYNAFCVGQPQDIVFPIPFTNKSITLQPNYVRNMLNSVGATWVITIIEAFWWYLISRYIIKDITSKITKIKSGNIESIENTNIKGDML